MYQCIGENLVQRVTQHMSLVMTTAVTVIMRKGQLSFAIISSNVWSTVMLTLMNKMILCMHVCACIITYLATLSIDP